MLVLVFICIIFLMFFFFSSRKSFHVYPNHKESGKCNQRRRLIYIHTYMYTIQKQVLSLNAFSLMRIIEIHFK